MYWRVYCSGLVLGLVSFSCLLLRFSSLLVASVAFYPPAPHVFRLFRHILPTHGALDAADADFNVADDQAAAVDEAVAVAVTDVSVDRHADVTIRLLIIIVIHSVINTSSYIISKTEISSISSIITIHITINLTQTQARHAAPRTEQHPPRKKRPKLKAR